MATLMLGVWSSVLDSSIRLKHRAEAGPTYIQRRYVLAINIGYLIKHIFLDCFIVKIFGEEYVVISRPTGIFYYILYVIKAPDVVISSGNSHLTKNQVFRPMTPTEGDQQGLFKADGIQTSIIGSWYIQCYLMRAEDGLQASWNLVKDVWWKQGSQVH